MLEGPAEFMRTRFVPATGHGAVEAVPAEDQQAYRETKLFKHELATRVGCRRGRSTSSTTSRSSAPAPPA